VFEPHLPSGWENISIDQLPVGTNIVSFSRKKTDQGIEYSVGSSQDGWKMFLKAPEPESAKYYLNDKQIPFDPAGIQLTQKTNKLLVVQQ
jgi:hypothetical protein